MSDADDAGAVRKVVGAVKRSSKGHSDTEMNTIGIGIALAVVFLLMPLLPFILIVVVVAKLVDLAQGRVD